MEGLKVKEILVALRALRGICPTGRKLVLSYILKKSGGIRLRILHVDIKPRILWSFSRRTRSAMTKSIAAELLGKFAIEKIVRFVRVRFSY